jgi:hypothetical protein
MPTYVSRAGGFLIRQGCRSQKALTHFKDVACDSHMYVTNVGRYATDVDMYTADIYIYAADVHVSLPATPKYGKSAT